MKSFIILLMFGMVKSWGDQGLGKKENLYDTEITFSTQIFRVV